MVWLEKLRLFLCLLTLRRIAPLVLAELVGRQISHVHLSMDMQVQRLARAHAEIRIRQWKTANHNIA